jgi:hypothetical protein
MMTDILGLPKTKKRSFATIGYRVLKYDDALSYQHAGIRFSTVTFTWNGENDQILLLSIMEIDRIGDLSQLPWLVMMFGEHTKDGIKRYAFARLDAYQPPPQIDWIQPAAEPLVFGRGAKPMITAPRDGTVISGGCSLSYPASDLEWFEVAWKNDGWFGEWITVYLHPICWKPLPESERNSTPNGRG